MNVNPGAYSRRVQKMFQEIFQFAARLEHGFIGSEHLLWGVAQSGDKASGVLRRHGFDADLIENYIKQHDKDAAAFGGARAIQFSGEVKRVVELAEEQAKELQQKEIEPAHLLLGILQEKGCAAWQLMESLGANAEEIQADLLAEQNSESWEDVKEEPNEREKPAEMLTQFSHDLTMEAKDGSLDPMIGREKEVERIVQILSRRTKNNPVLIGEPGVGKTAVAEGLAQRIADERVPKNLAGKRILSLDLTGMLSGTRFRGDFEKRIKGFLEEAISAGDVILFLDELHTLIGAGAGSGDDSMDAANILKPVLARGQLQIIGATTIGEYRRHVEKDAALERRFQPIIVEEPTPEDTKRILQGLRDRYEEFHEITITDEALDAAVELSARYIQDRFLPDKAIDVMDEAASRVYTRGMSTPPELQEMEQEVQSLGQQKRDAAKQQRYEEAAAFRDRELALRNQLEEKQADWQKEQGSCVDAEDIANVISQWTKIPVAMLTQDENQRLLALEKTLHERIVGQDAAVTAVARAIRRGRTGVAEPNRPMGSFLFLGPTGVGKTELCRTLAEVMFQDETAMIRLDMSEYMERHTVSKLIGAPPGYVGYDEGGQLTEQVRRKPYSLILFDEIEKAHPDVWNALLQIMDDGRLTDAQGRTVNFKNTLIVMTSNIGARDILGKKPLGFAQMDKETETRSADDIRDRVMDQVKKAFPPEFLNRLDETIVFHQLEREHIRSIAWNLTDRLTARMAKQGINLSVEDSAIDVLADEGFEPIYGARPLRRAIQSALETAVAEKILEEGDLQGDKIVATGENDQIKLTVHKKRKAVTA